MIIAIIGALAVTVVGVMCLIECYDSSEYEVEARVHVASNGGHDNRHNRI